jgi:hypothetical protein
MAGLYGTETLEERGEGRFSTQPPMSHKRRLALCVLFPQAAVNPVTPPDLYLALKR